MTSATQKFSLAAVLSVTTGVLLCPIGDVYAILNHMTGDNLFTHQLGRACRECGPVLRTQFPLIADETAYGVDGSNWQPWLAEAEQRYGKEFDVPTLPEHAHEFIDPISELAEVVHPDRMIVI